MNKMLLIDSLYISSGGALVVLQVLVKELECRQQPFFLLADERCGTLFDHLQPHLCVMKASLRERHRFYKEQREKFSAVLCLGNLPPALPLKVPTYTYFHNINLLTLDVFRGVSYAKAWLKRALYRFYRKNTDYWLVQTENTANELAHHLKCPREKVLLYPFFNLPQALKDIATSATDRSDYVFVGDYYKGHKGHDALLTAWKKLNEKGVTRTLHLTIDEKNPQNRTVLQRIAQLRADGVTIENHGFRPIEEVFPLYARSKATIYPSFNESLGLGIVEALTAGCDVLAPDLPYVHSICHPSMLFQCGDADSIVQAVLTYEKGHCPKSHLTIENRLRELIELICP